MNHIDIHAILQASGAWETAKAILAMEPDLDEIAIDLHAILDGLGWSQVTVSWVVAGNLRNLALSESLVPETVTFPPLNITIGHLDIDEVPLTNATKEEPFHMSIYNTTFVNGIDVNHMSQDSFIKEINRISGEIDRLEKVGVESQAISNSIAKLKGDRDQLVKLMDEKLVEENGNNAE